jgi:hypothetical protein
MYLDTAGKVTVGVDNMLPDSNSAAAVPFVHANGGDMASGDEIRAEFELVLSQQKGKVAANYKQYTPDANGR